MAILKFTGNPLIDNGNAVIAMMCNKNHFHEVTQEDIVKNIDSFLVVIQDHFNDLHATKKERDYSKRGFKQHFSLLYTTNHYLFGINNKIKNPDTGKKETVQTGQDFIKTFKKEVMEILEGKNKLSQEKQRQSNDNICRFCGRPADLVITKDIVPLATALTQKNLGQVHCCNCCYLSILFNFLTMINVRSSEASKGFYMFYHFSDERCMIEYARQQFLQLKREMLASLETKIGYQYEVLVQDLLDRFKRFKKKMTKKNFKNFFITVYYLLNDNRGASFKYINVPNGMCVFLSVLSTTENIWSQIKRNLISIDSYEKFLRGEFHCADEAGIPKYGFEDPTILKLYLREVSGLDEHFITAAQNIGKGLVKYYRIQSGKWVENYAKRIRVKKSYSFINELLDENESYFSLYGENIFSISDVKQVVGESSAMAYRLIKYYIYNAMDDEEREIYIDICRKQKNQGQEGA
ncbi:MAG: hypothetical protein MJA31_17555 [Clostridia bacterium]|nr:hypothetical protein [Clostridia bacterium]